MENLSDELRSQWHPLLNFPRTIETTNVSAKVWWLGMCGHEWETTIESRKRGSGCHVCAGKKICAGFNDFASQNPNLLDQWHPTKNLPLLPTDITARNSTKRIWWICSLNHEWQQTVLPRANGSGCPYCSGKNLLVGFNDLATTHPKLVAEWHPTKNLPLLPTQTRIGRREKVWWLGRCGHEWESIAHDRYTKKTGCIYCSGFRALKGFNDLATTHSSLLEEWDFTKNQITPAQITAGSGKKVWWKCSFSHEWETAVAVRATASRGCPVCSGNKVVQGFNDLASRSPHLMKEWHAQKNTLEPTVVSWSSGLKAWWICSEGHEWEAKISSRNNGAGCNICGYIRGGKEKSKPKTGVNDLASQFPELAKEFSSRNHPVRPEMVHVGTAKRFWWECSKGHEWETPVHYRTGKDRTNCPTCAPNIYISRQELAIKSFLESLGLTVETSDRKILKGKEIDLYLPAKKVGIEFNGVYWHTEENGKDSTYHYDKWRMAKAAGVELIQIWEDDFRDRKDAVLKMLARKLGVTSLLPSAYPQYSSEAVITPSAGLDVVTLPVDVAQDFLRENSVQGFTAGSKYLGLVNNARQVKAVLVLTSDSTEMSVISYTSVGLIDGGLRKLLDYMQDFFAPLSITALSDNCMGTQQELISSGFYFDDEIAPEHMYITNGERAPESGIADITGLPRIWDAGKMKYRLAFL